MDMNYRGGMWEGGGWAGWSGVGGKWDNCNSIINKYIKKNKREMNDRTDTKDRRDTLRLFCCYNVLTLPRKRYSVI